MFIGLLGIVAGIIVIQHPLWGSFVLPAVAAIILGIQGLIVGVVSLILAFKGGGWGVGILGVLSIVIGLLLLFNALVAGQILVVASWQSGALWRLFGYSVCADLKLGWY